MTRRLEPMDRVNELGDASVPFDFDVHAMIFSEEAPKLENALHKAFENKKLNMVNQRREILNVILEEIEKVVKENFDKTVELKKESEAEQFRQSLKIKDTVLAY
ncbi:GIY-YIG nuclease family protein [Clostridium perfringens]|nr:GIY-YIG nuclease family protein [Clostridium perfringens]